MAAHPNRQNMVLKPFTHVRVANLPLCPELTRTTIPRTADLFRFLAVTGATASRHARERNRCRAPALTEHTSVRLTG